MNRKDILELKRRFKKDQCTFTKLSGCYVNGEKQTLLTFKESFRNLPEEEFFKYLDITKKVLSGGVGNNILELTFPLNENFESDKQNSLMQLKRSGLKDDTLLEAFYESIIESYDYTGNFLILLFHDVYDVMTRTKDNIQLDESEEVYEYIMCAICPVSLSKPGLGYLEDESKIGARIRDWIVNPPVLGFTYPAFIDRSSDVNAIMYYTKNAKDPHPELMENALGCGPKQTATIQKETFQSIIESTVSSDEEVAEKVFSDIQDNLNTMIEEYNEIYEDTEAAPVTLTKHKVKEILLDSGVSEEATAKIEASYEDNFGDEAPLAENLIDKKIIKANEQKKKEEELTKKVEVLEQRLEEVKQTVDEDALSDDFISDDSSFDEDIISDDLEMASELDDEITDREITNGEEFQENIDVVLHVKPNKLNSIKTELINGQRCIVVPINDDEQATINGRKDLI